jgi:macrolide transport system ATP-binding/permease protein
MRFWRRKNREQELDRELLGHLELEAEEQRDVFAARRALGNPELIKEQVRDEWGWGLFDALGQDVRYALRSLRGSPVFALVAVASLGLGIGANTAIFSFVDALLLKRLPVPEAAQLAQVSEYTNGTLSNNVFSYPFVESLNQRNDLFDGALGRFPVRVNLATTGQAEPLNGEVVTGGYFTTLRVKPALGRLLTEQDISSGSPVCVISYDTWQKHLGGDPAIVGAKLLLNAHPYTVVGVTERGFFGAQLESRIDIQMPLSRMVDFMGGFFMTSDGVSMWKSDGFRWIQPLVRLKPGVMAAQAQTTIRATKHMGEKVSFRLSDGSQGTQSGSTYAKPVTVLMGVVALVLLIACANLANLLLARANARSKEFAVRLSLGASRWRLVRQFMVESVAIACCGGAIGLVLAFWIVQTLLAYLNAGHSSGNGVQAGVNPTVVGFSVALSLLTAMLFGLLPAWQSARPDVVGELKGSRQKTVGGMGIRRALIVAQIALSLMILFAAGLLTRTLSSLRTVDLGFNPARVITLKVDPAMNGHTGEQVDQVFDRILRSSRAQPGVTAASLAVVTPLEGEMIALSVSVPGHAATSADVQTNFNMVSPDYFKTLHQPLLAGRDFSDRDSKHAPLVAIVNQRFVAQYMPGQNPIGRHIKVGSGDTEIVGLAGDSAYQSLREDRSPIVYLPGTQTQNSGYTLMVRTKLEPAGAIKGIENAIRGIDPKLPIYGVRTMQDLIDQGISSERVLSFLSMLFSGLATLLCCMGIYGLIAYTVSRRTREIGVRFAIGAQKIDVAKLFLRESMVLVFAGILVGVPLAMASTRLLESLLFGVKASDPWTLGAAIGVFVFAGLLASLLPVLKAARMEPVAALRYE